MRTRNHMEAPPLCRMSALRRVRFTVEGRRFARRLALDDNAVYTHWFTSRDGSVIHHLCDGFVTHHVPAHLVQDMESSLTSYSPCERDARFARLAGRGGLPCSQTPSVVHSVATDGVESGAEFG